jgi:hypothetical protein
LYFQCYLQRWWCNKSCCYSTHKKTFPSTLTIASHLHNHPSLRVTESTLWVDEMDSTPLPRWGDARKVITDRTWRQVNKHLVDIHLCRKTPPHAKVRHTHETQLHSIIRHFPAFHIVKLISQRFILIFSVFLFISSFVPSFLTYFVRLRVSCFVRLRVCCFVRLRVCCFVRLRVCCFVRLRVLLCEVKSVLLCEVKSVVLELSVTCVNIKLLRPLCPYFMSFLNNVLP